MQVHSAVQPARLPSSCPRLLPSPAHECHPSPNRHCLSLSSCARPRGCVHNRLNYRQVMDGSCALEIVGQSFRLWEEAMAINAALNTSELLAGMNSVLQPMYQSGGRGGGLRRCCPRPARAACKPPFHRPTPPLPCLAARQASLNRWLKPWWLRKTSTPCAKSRPGPQRAAWWCSARCGAGVG